MKISEPAVVRIAAKNPGLSLTAVFGKVRTLSVEGQPSWGHTSLWWTDDRFERTTLGMTPYIN